MGFNWTITLGDALTAASIFVSTSGVVLTWLRHQQQRQREQADLVRRAAGNLVGLSDRWVEHALGLGDDIQPLFVDVDQATVEGKSVEEVRDMLWRGIVVGFEAVRARIRDDKIETAYAELSGYDPRVRKLFAEMVVRLRDLDVALRDSLLEKTQELILSGSEEASVSAAAGNKLRLTCHEVIDLCRGEYRKVVVPFQKALEKLIDASDKELADRSVSLPEIRDIYPRRWTRHTAFSVPNTHMVDSEVTELLAATPLSCLSPREAVETTKRCR